MGADSLRREVNKWVVPTTVASRCCAPSSPTSFRPRSRSARKRLVERHNLGVSSATVRNDMAVLEAEGYITQPHTSSGRVPTEKGYREFVDRLDEVKPLSSSERRAILYFLESGVDLDDVLRRAVRLLAQLTRQVAVVQYPTLSTSTRAAPRGGGADPGPAAAGGDHRLRPRRPAHRRTRRRHRRASARPAARTAGPGAGGQAAGGRVGRGVRPGRRTSTAAAGLRDAVGRSATVLVETLVEHSEERLLLGGTANLTRNTADFGGSLRSVLEALEEQVVVLQAAGRPAGGRQGHRAHRARDRGRADGGTSVVTTGLRQPGKVYGGMGVLGPTRMDYPGTIANVAAVALYIGEVLGSRLEPRLQAVRKGQAWHATTTACSA